MKALLELSEVHSSILRYLVSQISPEEYPWVLTGSAALRLQGVDIPVNDLDLHTNKETVYILEKMLNEFMKVSVHPWESPYMFSLHGQAEIEGITVELIGEIQHRSLEDEWENPVDIVSQRIWVTWQGHEIPVFPLEFEAQSYEKMGRNEKARLIREAIHE